MKKLFLLLFFGIFFISFVNAECNGGADLDINKIERTPGDSIFKIVATANGNGDCLNIAWTKEDINNLLNKASPDELTNKDITGSINLVSQEEKFNTYGYESLYKYNIDSPGWFGSCESLCKNKGYQTLAPDGYAIRNGFIFGCYCVHKSDLIGSVGNIGSRTFNDKVNVLFSGLNPYTIDTSYSQTSDAVGSGNIGGKVDIVYRGSLIGNNFLTPPAFNPFKKPDGSHLLVKGTSSLAVDISTTLINCLGNAGNSDLAQGCISDYNNRISSLFAVDKTQDWVSSQNIVKTTSFIGDDLIVEKNIYSTTWPQFTLTFDAAWAGVHWITGQPKVTCPNSGVFDSGETKETTFLVQNVANEKGAFSLDLNCGDLSSTLSTNKMLLDLGQFGNVTSTLTFSTDQDQNFNCNFKAYATRDPSKSDECSFSVEVKKVDKPIVNIGNSSSSSITGNIIGSSGVGESKGMIILVIFVILIVGLISYLIYSKKKGKSKEEVSINDKKESSGKHCTKCGHPLKVDAQFCNKCGEKAKVKAKVKVKKKRK
ncbi:zinc ribbon domain-containing protein [Candidatus Pacearchaeota archaeon]|nr:zinc ribbon domain-containing protein [Candidatus Pacearchaeota archaeon]